MGLHLCYELAADESADPGALLEPVRRFAATLPFDRMYGLIAGAVASLREPPGSESWLQAVAELRRKLPPEPSPDR